MSNNILSLSKVSKEFDGPNGKVRAVNDVNLAVPQGQFVSIVGKSGSGKSTLLGILGALDRPTNGSIVVDGQNLEELSEGQLSRYRAQTIGFVFQSYNLIPNLTAIENVMLPMEFVGTDNQRERATKLLEEVGLSIDKQGRRPGRLSGGEQQRVAIARALANKPKLILADEPTGNLDSQTGKMIFDLLHQLSRSENTTIIVVTHDLSIAGKTDMTFKLSDGRLVNGKS